MASDGKRWRDARAPSLEEMEALASEAYAALPEQFRALCEGLVIRVEDFPTEEVLEDMRAQTEFDLLGLFQGVGLPFRSESAPEAMPPSRKGLRSAASRVPPASAERLRTRDATSCVGFQAGSP